MKFLGIDVGSTFLKSSILDLETGEVLEAASAPTPAFAETDPAGNPLGQGRREIPMDRLAQAVKALIDAAAEKYPIAGVTFSVQMHGGMLLRPDGTPVTNYISWQDTRGTIAGENGISVLEELRGSEYKDYFEENGVLLRPNHSVVAFTHYARENGIAPGTCFAMIGDALTWMLTGTRAFIHPTNAASSGMYSLRRGQWNRELLRKLGLGGLSLPEVKAAREPAGIYKAANGNEIPLYAALGDQQASVLGIGTRAGDVFINIGTGGQIGYAANEPLPGPYETRPYFDGCFIRTITQLPSGRTINILMEFLKSIGRDVFGAEAAENTAPEGAAAETPSLEERIWKYIDSIDFENIGSEPLTMDFSYFDPEGGMVGGIKSENFTIANLIRSAYLAIAREYASHSADLAIPADAAGEAVCTGGVIRKNKPLFRCIEQVFPRPCRIAACTDDSMTGLLIYGKWCVEKERQYVMKSE